MVKELEDVDKKLPDKDFAFEQVRLHEDGMGPSDEESDNFKAKADDEMGVSH